MSVGGLSLMVLTAACCGCLRAICWAFEGLQCFWWVEALKAMTGRGEGFWAVF